MFSLNKMEDYQPYVAMNGVFSPDQLSAIRAMIEGQETTQGLIGDKNFGLNPDIRSSQVIKIRGEEKNGWIYNPLAAAIDMANTRVFGLDLSYIENIQLAEYDASYQGHYGMHMDASYGKSAVMNNRKLSVSIQLSSPDEYEGGDLLLYPNNLHYPEKCPRELGTVILFRSHIIHEVTPVTSGKRYSLVAWVNGPYLR